MPTSHFPGARNTPKKTQLAHWCKPDYFSIELVTMVIVLHSKCNANARVSYDLLRLKWHNQFYCVWENNLFNLFQCCYCCCCCCCWSFYLHCFVVVHEHSVFYSTLSSLHIMISLQLLSLLIVYSKTISQLVPVMIENAKIDGGIQTYTHHPNQPNKQLKCMQEMWHVNLPENFRKKRNERTNETVHREKRKKKT